MTRASTGRNGTVDPCYFEPMSVGLGLALASIVSFGPPVLPEDPPLSDAPDAPHLQWDAPLECPDPRWVADHVGAYLGRPLADEPDVYVTAHVRVQAARFVLDLATDAGGVRDRQQLEHHDCAALAEIAASLAAISIDPLALGSDVDSARPPAPSWPPGPPGMALGVEDAVVVSSPQALAPAQPPTPSPPPNLHEQPLLVELYADPDASDVGRPEPDPRRRTQVSIGASAGLALALFPNPAPEVHGSVGISRGGPRAVFRAELLGGAILAGRFRSADGLAGGDLLAWDVAVRPCGVPRWGIVELRACASIGAGQIRARGVNVEPALQRAHPWVWVSPELGLGFAVSRRVALFVDLGAHFNVYRPRFSISNPDAEFVTPIASARGRLGIELRFL
jgi:hypothetical protein